MNTYEVIVIGGGPAGYVAAIRAAQKGYTVACVSPTLGGTCLHEGCIPSKFLLNMSDHYHFMNNDCATFGIKADKVELDLSVVMNKKQDIINNLSNGIEHLFAKYKIKHIKQTAILQDNKQVLCADNSVLKASKSVILAAGSKIISIPFKTTGDVIVDNSTTALQWSAVPKKLLIVGAGYIGLELASVWARLGTQVEIIDLSTTFLPFLDTDVSDIIMKSLQKLGIKFHFGVQVSECIKTSTNEILVHFSNGQQWQGDKFLSAVGRQAVTNCYPANLKTDQKGFVIINEALQTNLEGVYAVGDIAGGALLAHKASDEGWRAVEHLYANNPPSNDKKVKKCIPSAGHIPSVIYLHPEVAIIGETEKSLQEKKIEYKVSKSSLAFNGRAMTMSATIGFVKVLSSKKDDTILGVCAVGQNAESMVCQAAIAMSYAGTTNDIATICYPHPSVDETFREAMFGSSIWGPLHG